LQQSASQPYWYSAPYAEGANGGGSQGNNQEGGGQVRDRDVKTQRRKEANRESARRSKQRKKEESELLSSKAHELVRESMSLRAELDKVQKQADKLYAENLELRSQVTAAGGSLPPSLPPVVTVKLPPPIEIPASLLKEIMGSSPAAKKETPPSSNASGAGGKDENKEEREKKRQKTSAIKQTGARTVSASSHDQGGIDLPGLLENELNAGEANAEQFVQLSAPAYDGNGNSGGACS
jgi:plant G-box-binding factor